MDLKHLNTFNTVCEMKNFTATAKKLFISQSTVSLHIKTLEAELGLKLFSRKNRARGQVTEAGLILYEYSKRISDLMDETTQALNSYKEGTSGSLSLAVSHTICAWNLPDILERFNNLYPLIDITLFSEFSPKIIEMVSKRKIHLGIVRTFNDRIPNSQIVSECISVDNLVLVYSSKHPLNKINKPSFEDFAKEPIIAYGINTDYWSQIDSLYKSHYVQPTIGMELNDIKTVKKMIELGLGVSILPEISVKEDLEEGSLVKLEDKDYDTLKRYSLLIHHKDQAITKSIKEFIKINKTYGLKP